FHGFGDVAGVDLDLVLAGGADADRADVEQAAEEALAYLEVAGVVVADFARVLAEQAEVEDGALVGDLERDVMTLEPPDEKPDRADGGEDEAEGRVERVGVL